MNNAPTHPSSISPVTTPRATAEHLPSTAEAAPRRDEAPIVLASSSMNLGHALSHLSGTQEVHVRLQLSAEEITRLQASTTPGIRLSGAPELGQVVISGQAALLREVLSTLTQSNDVTTPSPVLNVSVEAPDSDALRAAQAPSDRLPSLTTTSPSHSSGISFYARSEASPFLDRPAPLHTPDLPRPLVATSSPEEPILPVSTPTVLTSAISTPAASTPSATSFAAAPMATAPNWPVMQSLAPSAPASTPTTPAPPANAIPLIITPIADQNATEDSPFSLSFAVGDFLDPDASDSLSYTAQAWNGSAWAALPSWLSFDAATRTFAGTPLNPHVGTLTLRVIASDGRGGSVADSFQITVANTNDAPTALSLSATSIAENSAAGTVVATLLGSDPDSGDTLSYSFAPGGNPSGLFALVGNQLQVSGALNFEAATSHNVTLRVTDASGLTHDQAFTIGITNVNEAPATLLDSNASANSIAENAANGTVVGVTALATDPDAGETFTYSLSDNAGGRFAIDASTGVVTVADGSLLNFEAASSHSVTVRVTDAGGLTRDQSFTIGVTNVNEAPKDLVISSAAINENSALNTVIGTLSAVDDDTGNTHTYTLLSDPDGKFVLSGNQLLLNGSLNFEQKASHNVQIRVTDNTGLSYTETLTIAVNNVNDAPVTFNQTFTIAENSTVGALVVRANGLNPLNRVAASDEDAGASLTYSLLSGNTGGTFALDSTTGQISIANASLLDFEVPANRSYTLTVRVSDGTLSADAIVTINLTDINETLTLPTLSASSIAENSPNGTVIGTLAATDPEGAPITYTLTNNAGGRFTIVGNELRVANGSLLDFEANASHSITVQASDGVNAQTQNFTVNILDLNEGSLNNLPGSLSGNEDTTFTLSGITLSDPTPGTPNNVTFTVASGSLTLSTSVGGGITGGMVTGNGTASVTITGATQAQINATLADTNGLRFTPAANANGSVLLTMSADDGSGNTDTDAMAITVNAVNDAPTLGNVTSSLTVAENTINAAAQLIDADITLSDIDNPASLNGGNVRVSYVSGGAATDTLSVRHQGNAAGQIGVSGTTVSFGGVAIGTIQASPNNGVGTNALQINLNSSATIAAVEALLENLTYQTSSNTPAATRTLRLTVNDGQGGTSANTDVTVNITAENDAPVIAAPVGAQGFTTAQAYAYTIPGGTFTDPEGNALTYSMAFSTNNGASFTAGTPAWLSFNASTLALAVTAGTGVAGAYQLRLTASDGSTSTDHIIQLAVTNPGNAYTGAVAQTLAGGAGADVIISGDGADLIYGGAGHDTVYGRGGNDSIFLDHITAGSGVNTGNDLAYGGDGNDSMLGEYQIGLTSGSDTLYGEAGNDTLRSSGGNDWLDGGADNDSLIAGSGNDTVYGGTGIDTIFGEENNDSLFGDDGNDWIDGGADNDVLSGGNGDDTLIGGSDSDTMSGGAGADIFEYANFASKFAAFDIITDFETGIDKLRLPFFTGIVEGQGNASGSVLEWYQTGSGGTAKTIIRANPAEYDFYIEMTGHKSLTLSDFIFFGTTGSNGADTITGTAVTDAILGGGGDDIIYGLAGNDLILGDAGNDTIYGSGGTDEIYGGDGNDWIEGGSGINTIYGGNGDDTLNFENYTTGVASILYGGAGNDVFRFSSTMEMRNTGYGIIEDFIKGSDRIWLDGLTFTGIYIGAGDTARTQEMFIAYNASLDLTFITSNRLSWGGNNQIALRGDFATNADSSLNLTASDFIFSNNLVDNAPGDADPTVGVIREALDTTRQGIMGSSGNDTIYAGYSARGWDNIAALDGNDLVIYKYDATAPVDRSGTFSDTGRPDIDLGLGDDRMFLVNARGTAVGADTYGVVSRSFHDTGSDTIVGGNNTKIMNNSSNLVTSQPGVVDLIIAYAQSDDLLGGGGSDIFYGGRGNESNLTGLGGNDTLYGGEGNDGAIGNRFSGDGGNDVLIGGYGSDIMYGGGVTPGLGSGADTFIIYDPLESRNAIGSRDAIMDYGSDDSIILHGFTGIGAGATEVTITNYTASQFGQVNANWTDITASSAGIDFRLTVFGTFSFTGGANGTITFNAGTLLTNVATNFTGTSSADFIAALEGNDTVSAGDGNDSVWGGDGNDSLLGEAGNDSLSGGFGNDTLIGGIGADTLEAGSGVDRFVFSSGDSDTITGMDVIWDFREGNDADIIDLSDSALDALAPGGSLDWGDLVFSTPDQIGGYMTRVTISGTSFGFQLVGYWEKDYNIAAADFVF